jgi:hypothetical protein
MISYGQQSLSVNRTRSVLDNIGKSAFVVSSKRAPASGP